MSKQLTLPIPSDVRGGFDDIETRFLEYDELRIEGDDAQPIIRVAIRFNTLSVPLWGFREKIANTAFDGTLEDETKEVLGYWNHNSDLPLGRRSTGTVEISKTATLFKASIMPNMDTEWGRSAVASIKRGDVKGSSFGFRTLPDGDKWEEDEEQNLIRTLTNIDLREVSPTPSPAYPKSSASVRSTDEIRHALKIARSRDTNSITSDAVASVLREHEERKQISIAQLADRQRRDRLHRENFRQFPT